jgi:hypothetical protein
VGSARAERVQVEAGRALTVVVPERPRRVDLLWGFLSLVFAAALVRGHFGASSTTSRLVVDLGFGTLLVGSIAAWIWFRRHPARLEITPEAVAFEHRGQSGSTRLVRPGELYIRTTLVGGTDRLNFLKVTGSDEAIVLTMFDHEEVKAACRANGWRFVGDGAG